VSRVPVALKAGTYRIGLFGDGSLPGAQCNGCALGQGRVFNRFSFFAEQRPINYYAR
jgi:hypothetical protein